MKNSRRRNGAVARLLERWRERRSTVYLDPSFLSAFRSRLEVLYFET